MNDGPIETQQVSVLVRTLLFVAPTANYVFHSLGGVLGSVNTIA